MADIASRGNVAKLNVVASGATGTPIAVELQDRSKTVDKHELPISPRSIQSSNSEEQSPTTSACITIDDAQNTNEHKDMTDAIEKHLHWLRNHEERSWIERTTWLPPGSGPDTKAEDIIWGRSAIDVTSTGPSTPNTITWDEIGSQVFEHALKAQADFNTGQQDSKSLSHVELDVQGLDAKGNHIRVRRALEVKLRISNKPSSKGPMETITMQLQRVLMIANPYAFSLPASKPQDKEPYQALLEQVAQHEVNKALDERNHFLREVFRQDVDHVRKRRESTIEAHDWSFQRPGLCIQGVDGTIISLREERTDSAVDDEVVLTHSIAIQQVRGKEMSHLFDLTAEGSESERRIRQARWTLSSAIDRCLAPASAERFVLDRWVDGTFLPRDHKQE